MFEKPLTTSAIFACILGIPLLLPFICTCAKSTEDKESTYFWVGVLIPIAMYSIAAYVVVSIATKEIVTWVVSKFYVLAFFMMCITLTLVVFIYYTYPTKLCKIPPEPIAFKYATLNMILNALIVFFGFRDRNNT